MNHEGPRVPVPRDLGKVSLPLAAGMWAFGKCEGGPTMAKPGDRLRALPDVEQKHRAQPHAVMHPRIILSLGLSLSPSSQMIGDR